jgi:hypothetical protein
MKGIDEVGIDQEKKMCTILMLESHLSCADAADSDTTQQSTLRSPRNISGQSKTPPSAQQPTKRKYGVNMVSTCL